jgi:hypothetical protein
LYLPRRIFNSRAIQPRVVLDSEKPLTDKCVFSRFATLLIIETSARFYDDKFKIKWKKMSLSLDNVIIRVKLASTVLYGIERKAHERIKL